MFRQCLFGAVFLVFFCVTASAATIYRGVDDSGTVMFSDRPIAGVKQQSVTELKENKPQKTPEQAASESKVGTVAIPKTEQEAIQAKAADAVKKACGPYSDDPECFKKTETQVKLPERPKPSLADQVWDSVLDVK